MKCKVPNQFAELNTKAQNRCGKALETGERQFDTEFLNRFSFRFLGKKNSLAWEPFFDSFFGQAKNEYNYL
ncbi:hypothetical protein [Seonamhaeicola maritimus]|uniref:hypothetical protein n=1 Tax=Seonamhaeicola maritimus TaxID=2591822 RepID=UPI002495885C|nr:hypothetical protein [Seonamhaeicola maritimus]